MSDDDLNDGRPPQTGRPLGAEPVTERGRATVRRSPRLFNFVLAGVLLGAIVAFVLTVAFPTAGEFSQAQVFGFLALFACTVFGVLAAVLALLLERASRRRAREVDVEIERGSDPDA